ncbi:MAG TPA: rod-binding protein, partial [bacterium]|nr:rod-binding protein [bacterium]
MDGTFGVGFQGLSESRRLRKTAEELEAVVLAQLLSTMRNTVPEGGLFEKSAADDIFRSMFDQELARVMAEKSPFGLADEIVERFENRIKDDTPPT